MATIDPAALGAIPRARARTADLGVADPISRPQSVSIAPAPAGAAVATPVPEALPRVPRVGSGRLAGRPWSRWLLGVPVALLAAVALLLGTAGMRRIDPAAAGAGAASTGAPGTGVAGAAVAGLVAPGGSDPATVPARFEAVMGYAPVPERLAGGAVRLVKADGACSAPGGGTRFGFDAACRAHDYGYDLLRYANATGEALSGDARKLIDGMFAGDLRAHCRATTVGLPALGCRATADVFTTAAGINSWRQGFGNPGPEAPPVWLLGIAAAMVAVPAAPRVGRRLRGRPRHRAAGPEGRRGGQATLWRERTYSEGRYHVQRARPLRVPGASPHGRAGRTGGRRGR